MANKKNRNIPGRRALKRKRKNFVGRASWSCKVNIDSLKIKKSIPVSSQDNHSADKISTSSKNIDKIKSDELTLDVVSIAVLSQLIKVHALCRKCNCQSLKLRSVQRSGLACDFFLACNVCGDRGKVSNSIRREYISDGKSFYLESVNLALITASRISGFGREAAKRLLAFCNFRNPPDNWLVHQSILREVFKMKAEQSMDNAANEVQVHAEKEKIGVCASFDGSWMKKGLISLIGFVSSIGVHTGKVIGIDIRSKYCATCKNKSTENFPCKLGSKCGINHRGSSGGMESEGAVEIIRSLDKNKNLRISHYLGDGDCKAFAKVNSTFDWLLTKWECVNHYAKKMGNHLLKKKQSIKGLGGSGKGSLTNDACRKIQSYYHWIITTSKGDVPMMKRRIEALYQHLVSSDRKPDHSLCEAKYCKYLQSSEKKVCFSKKFFIFYFRLIYF